MSFSDNAEEMRYCFYIPAATFQEKCKKEYDDFVVHLKGRPFQDIQSSKAIQSYILLRDTFLSLTGINIDIFQGQSERGKPFKFKFVKDLGAGIDLDFYDKFNNPKELFFVTYDPAFDRCDLGFEVMIYVNWD